MSSRDKSIVEGNYTYGYGFPNPLIPVIVNSWDRFQMNRYQQENISKTVGRQLVQRTLKTRYKTRILIVKIWSKLIISLRLRRTVKTIKAGHDFSAGDLRKRNGFRDTDVSFLNSIAYSCTFICQHVYIYPLSLWFVCLKIKGALSVLTNQGEIVRLISPIRSYSV